MLKNLKKALPLGLLISGAIATSAIAGSYTLRVGSGHPSAPTAYVTGMEKVFVPNIKKRVAAETKHKIKIIEAYAGKIAKVHETLEAVEKGLLDIGSYCVCFETAKLFIAEKLNSPGNFRTLTFSFFSIVSKYSKVLASALLLSTTSISKFA